MNRTCRLAFVALLVVTACTGRAAAQPTVSTIATGLSDPRGLAFGPAGDLFVAEAWTGPGSLTTSNCYQSMIGPFTGGFTSRIVTVRRGSSTPTVVADGFPSSQAAVGDTFGVAGLAFVGSHLLALSGGGGCSHGHPEAVAEVVAVDGASRRTLANLSEWLLLNPGQKGVDALDSPDYEPDGSWYSMTFDGGRLLALEPNHGLLVEIAQTGPRLVKDLYREAGDRTWASMVFDRGDLYVGGYGAFADNFSSVVIRVSRKGAIETVASGLTAVLGLTVDRRHRLYAIQAPIFDGQGGGLGSLVRIDPDGSHAVILSGLVSPGSLTTGPDGALYLAQCSFHCAPGSGWVSRVVVD